MITQKTLDLMVKKIHSFPELSGCPVGFYGNGQCQLLHGGYSGSPNSDRVAVIIEEFAIEDKAVLDETKRWADTKAGSPALSPNPTVVTNRSKMGPELLGMGLSCGLTIISALGVVGGAAGEVFTGGTSTFLVVAGWVGLGTQGVQCLNGLVRVGAIAVNPDGDTLDQWDKEKWYTGTMFVVDAIGVASGVASLPLMARNLWAVMARQKSFISRGLTLEKLRAMSRVDRLRIVSEITEEASKTPEGREAIIKAAREAGIGAKTIQRTNGLSVNHAQKMVRIITDETIRRVNYGILDIAGEVGGIVTSTMPESWIGSGSGSINVIINLIDTQAPAGQ
jgi:hypothetical protein